MAEYIDREKVLLAVMNAGCTAKTVEVLMNTPAAEVEPVRRGVWEWDIGDVYACSQCGEKSHVKKVMGEPAWEYCPNCGAKMEGWRD